jgi:hypothetical protein
MYRTWAWGYHSLRQIYNGVLFALFIHYVEVHFLLQSSTCCNTLSHHYIPPYTSLLTLTQSQCLALADHRA